MSDVRAAIEAANREFVAAFNRGDAASIAALYMEEGKILPPNMEMMQGKAAVQAFWQGAMDMGCKEATLETVELEEQGAAAIEIGKYTLKIQLPDGGIFMDNGKYLVVWKQEGGAWKLDQDIWNSSLPAAG